MPEAEVKTETPNPQPTEPKPHVFPDGQVPEWAKSVPAKLLRATEAETLAAVNKSYTELEKKFGERKQPEVKPTGEVKITTGEPAEDMDVSAFIAKAGLKNEDVVAAWKADGKLTGEMYQKLGMAGLTKSVVNSYLEGTAAKATLAKITQAEIRTGATKLAGGEQQLKALLTFAGAELEPERVADLNRRLGDAKLYAGAVAELRSEYNEAVGAGKYDAIVAGDKPSEKGPAGSLDEYQKLNRLAAQGDPGARARLMATSEDTIRGWLHK